MNKNFQPLNVEMLLLKVKFIKVINFWEKLCISLLHNDWFC